MHVCTLLLYFNHNYNMCMLAHSHINEMKREGP